MVTVFLFMNIVNQRRIKYKLSIADMLYRNVDKADLEIRRVHIDFYYKLVLLNLAVLGFSISASQVPIVDSFQYHYNFIILAFAWVHQFLAIIFGLCLAHLNLEHTHFFNSAFAYLEDKEGSVEHCMPIYKHLNFIDHVLKFIYYYLTIAGIGFLLFYAISIHV